MGVTVAPMTHSLQEFLVGYGRVVDAGGGRGARIRLVRARTGRAACRRRVRATDSRTRVRRGLRVVRVVRADASPPVDRVGAHRTGRGQARRRPRSSTTSRCSPRRATPACRRGSACTTSRSRAGSPRWAKAGSSTTAPARTTGRATSRSARRRSAISCSAGSRSTSRPRTPASTRRVDVPRRRATGGACSTCWARRCSRSATRGASCAAAASRSRRCTTCRRSSRCRKRCPRQRCGEGSRS